MFEKCVCGKSLVTSAGNSASDTLIILGQPDWDEVKNGLLMSGDSADPLIEEFGKVGMQLRMFRVTSLYGHRVTPKEMCDLDFHSKRLWKEMKGKKNILILGDEMSKLLVDGAPIDFYGLEIKPRTFNLLPKSVRTMVGPSPYTLISGFRGEMVNALQNFREMINEHIDE